MLLNCREVPSGTTLEADVCIIGAGPAGLTIAKELRGRGLRIAVLERGGPPGDPLGLIYDGVTSEESDFEPPPQVPGRFAGGANEWIVRLPWHRNGVRIVPLSPIDLACRDWVPNSGWPIDWDELERYYRRAHELLGLGRWGYEVETWETPDHCRLPLEPYGFTTAMERFSSAEVFTQQAWQELRAAPDVTVCLHAPVGSLTGSSGEVERIDIDAGERGRVGMKANAYVLACGGLDNPRLLLSANGERGIGNAHDMVGRYYMDHLRYISGEIVPVDRRLFTRSGLYDIRSTPYGLVMGKLAPTDELLESEALLQSGATILPRPPAPVEAALDEVMAALRALRRGDRPDRRPPLSSFARVAAHMGRTAPEMAIRQRRFPPRTDAGWSSTWGNARRYARFSVEHQLEQAPDRENRVRLGKARNEFGRPSVDLVWRWGEHDLRSARTTQQLFGQAVEQSGVGRFEARRWTDRPPVTTPAGAYHPMGATRMHTDPRQGVVDANAKVHGVRNLFVAGSSTFSTGGYANPTFSLLALSVRLADHLVRGLCARVQVAGSAKLSMYWIAALGSVLS